MNPLYPADLFFIHVGRSPLLPERPDLRKKSPVCIKHHSRRLKMHRQINRVVINGYSQIESKKEKHLFFEFSHPNSKTMRVPFQGNWAQLWATRNNEQRFLSALVYIATARSVLFSFNLLIFSGSQQKCCVLSLYIYENIHPTSALANQTCKKKKLFFFFSRTK